MRNALLLFIFVFILIVSCNKKTVYENALSVVNKYFQYHNDHEVEKTLTIISDSIRFVMNKSNVERGKNSIRKLEEWNAAVYGRLSIPDMTLKGDTVFMSEMSEFNQWYLSLGIDSVQYNEGTYAIVKRGLITEFHPSALERNSAIEVSAKLKQFMKWADENRMAELYNLMPEGQFDYSAKNAYKWLELMREWKAETNTSD